jgi:uncharacterized protein
MSPISISRLSPAQQAVIDKTVEYVRQSLSSDQTGHDWWHIYRVWKTAIYLAEQEQANLYVVQLAALLHDIADWKFHEGDNQASSKATEKWLTGMGIDAATIEQVVVAVEDVTFKGAKVNNPIRTLEGKIVQDADRLDAMGAIGVARAFTYGGYKGRPLHDPELPPVLHTSFEAYKKHQGTTINHFYEKLLLLKDLMNTKTGKMLAETRHQFMEDYLRHFMQEWNVEF